MQNRTQDGGGSILGDGQSYFTRQGRIGHGPATHTVGGGGGGQGRSLQIYKFIILGQRSGNVPWGTFVLESRSRRLINHCRYFHISPKSAKNALSIIH